VLFSGMEIAFISSNKIYLEIEKKQDNFLSKILTKLTENHQSSYGYAYWEQYSLGSLFFFMGSLLMNQIDSGYHFSDLLNLLIQTVLSTLIVLMTAEFLPKVFSNLCQWFNQILFASLCFLFVVFYFICFLKFLTLS
jgi:CBS domain containing-hemolysin-like protein